MVLFVVGVVSFCITLCFSLLFFVLFLSVPLSASHNQFVCSSPLLCQSLCCIFVSFCCFDTLSFALCFSVPSSSLSVSSRSPFVLRFSLVSLFLSSLLGYSVCVFVEIVDCVLVFGPAQTPRLLSLSRSLLLQMVSVDVVLHLCNPTRNSQSHSS